MTLFPMTFASIDINGVCKSFGSGRGKRQVLYDLSLHIADGEVFGFLGPNGAGKSTTIKLLLNFLIPDRGTLSIMGRRVGVDEFRNNIGYLPEFPFFYDHLTARETLLLSGRLSGMHGGELESKIIALLDRLHLADAIDQKVKGFSKGMKQRLGMANALIHDPKIMIFDEPMSGLDPLGRHLLKNVIKELREQGRTIFFSSHILSDIEELCDRIGIIHQGHLLYAGLLGEFLDGGGSLEDRFVQIIRDCNYVADIS